MTACLQAKQIVVRDLCHYYYSFHLANHLNFHYEYTLLSKSAFALKLQT